MVDHVDLLAAQCNNWTEDEKDVMDILLNLPELIENLTNLSINYGQDQLVPWGWKKRRSAVNSPLTPFPSPVNSPLPSASSSPPRRSKLKPRVAHTKEQLVEEINELKQRKKVHQEGVVQGPESQKRQIQFNNTLKELTARSATLAPNEISL
ncbi:hypothetical protein P3L10_011974 [Capsicum annuum]